MKTNNLLNFEEAVELIDKNTVLNKTGALPFEKCAGLILAKPIIASTDVPAFTNSAMDGFAVISNDLINASKKSPVKLEIIETVAAGAQSITCPGNETARGKKIYCGKCVAIMTGAPVPQDTDAVVKVEDTSRSGNFVTFFAPVSKEENIRFKGEEAEKGDPLVPAGSVITPGVIALASSLGMIKLEVYTPPKIAIIITGDEVLPPHRK